jgi:hypothetical protein
MFFKGHKGAFFGVLSQVYFVDGFPGNPVGRCDFSDHIRDIKIFEESKCKEIG